MAREHTGRVHYLRVDTAIPPEQQIPIQVIYDVFSDGSETFSDREYGEIRWYDCEPSLLEREEARRLLREGVDDTVVDMKELRARSVHREAA